MKVPQEVIDFATSTGNSFHSKVVAKFRENKWHTSVSPYYLDASTNRAREIDLIAEKAWSVPAFYGGGSRLHIKLFVECKYVAEKTVFWFDTKDVAAAKRWLARNTPLPDKINFYTDKHHYIQGGSTVAKLFGTKADRETDREAIYRALNQALHSMVYLSRKGSIIPNHEGGHLPSRIVELPVIVVNSFDKFFRVDMGEEEVTPLRDNFLLEVNYAYLDPQKGNRSEYFLVDVISYETLDDFFRSLEGDVDAMKPLMENLRSR